jgi:endonuclease VIII-like 1
MPEIVEVRIMSDFINEKSKDMIFTDIYDVAKGNNDTLYISSSFLVSSDTNGKELRLYINLYNKTIPIYVFMGMSGNWKYVDTETWSDTKYTRLRIDGNNGKSLILHGGFMGPKYSIGKKFTGSERGPDPMKNFDNFKSNIISNLSKKDFDKPIYETLLNQKYFNGIGNYMRSTILYYLDENPFQSAREVITKKSEIIELCRDVSFKSYELHGGQLRDWKNPFDVDSTEFKDWVYYKKGNSIKDKNNRTFWYNPKWKN